jgi:membrane protein DedA with SNARE-associated domain
MDHFVASWGYVALLVITTGSAMGIPVGSEIAIGYSGALASGALAAGSAHLDLAIVIVVAALGDLVGSFFGYVVGRVGGRPLAERAGRYVLITRADLDRAEAWFARRGDSLVFFGRFVPFLRSFVSLSAGVAGMPVARFTAYTAAACAIWCGALAGIGYALGSSWHRVLDDVSYAGYGAVALVVLAVVVILGMRLRRVRLQRVRPTGDNC